MKNHFHHGFWKTSWNYRVMRACFLIKLLLWTSMNLYFDKKNSRSHKHYKKLIKLFKGGLLNVQTPWICLKPRPKTLDETNVLELHFLEKKKKQKQKQQKIKLSLHAGGGSVLASSSMLMSSELVWRRELVAAPRLSFMTLKSRLGKFSAASSLKSSNPAA